jgi:hypothetical protein
LPFESHAAPDKSLKLTINSLPLMNLCGGSVLAVGRDRISDGAASSI